MAASDWFPGNGTALEEYLQTVVRKSFPIFASGEAAAAWHAQERVRLEKIGQMPAYVDGQIAAIAYIQDL